MKGDPVTRIRIRALLIACLVTAGIFRSDAGTSSAQERQTQSATDGFDLDEATIAGLMRDQQAGRYTARRIAEQYLARIQALDRNGPSLHSILELRGLGKELWKDIDPVEHVRAERDSWDS